MQLSVTAPRPRSGALQLVASHPLLCLVALAALVRLAFFAKYAAGASDPLAMGGGDGGDYFRLGSYLTHHLAFDQPAFMLRPPGYPAAIALGLLAVPGQSAWVAVAVNMIVSTATVPLTYRLAKLLGLGSKVALTAGAIMAIEPTSA